MNDIEYCLMYRDLNGVETKLPPHTKDLGHLMHHISRSAMVARRHGVKIHARLRHLLKTDNGTLFIHPYPNK